MWLLWVAVALLALRYFEISWFATLSWWWVSALFGLAFLWFEFGERLLGLEGKSAMDEMDVAKKKRIKKSLEREKRPGRPGA
jgi:small Trp-rich protein